jgi:hypothetical protein
LVNSSSVVVAQQNTNASTTQTIQIDNNHEEPVEDIPPLFFFFIGIVFLTFIGIIPLGIVSGAFFIGLYKKSFSVGFQTLLISVCSTISIVGVISLLFVLNLLFDWFSAASIILGGICVGGFLGLTIGFLLFVILKKLAKFFEKKMHLNTSI